MILEKPLALAANLSVLPWQQAFEQNGRAHIPNFLTVDAAAQIFESLDTQETWNFVCQYDGQHLDLSDKIEAAWSPAELAGFTSKVHEQASQHFLVPVSRDSHLRHLSPADAAGALP
ncbi:hypothetical protein N8290_01930 [Pseudomonadales bacterium]|nr:hypothetical protein [Pseudomonadales bacterium]MDC1368295.1 hypothetical protein [Pseudomonadales bacterium]